MAKSDIGGRWVTLEGGRRVFIKEGQSLSEAMSDYNKNKPADQNESEKKETQDQNKKKKDEIEKKLKQLREERKEYEDKIEALQEQYDGEDNIPDYQLDQLDAWAEEVDDIDYNIEKLEKQGKELGVQEEKSPRYLEKEMSEDLKKETHAEALKQDYAHISDDELADMKRMNLNEQTKFKDDKEKLDKLKKEYQELDDEGSRRWYQNKKKSETKDEADDDLKDMAMDAWYDGDIEKKELVDDYFGGDEHKANQALFEHFNDQDNDTLTDTAMEAYKNGDISYDDLVRDYFYGDKKIAADYIQKTKADSTGTLANDRSDQKLVNQAYLENSETAKPKSKYSEEELYGVYEMQDASDVYAYLSGNEKEELRELTGKSTNSVEELNRIHELEEKAAERYLDDYDDEFSQLDEKYYSSMNKGGYEELAVKDVTDSDGFNTEYTMYKTPDGKYKTVFGDRDLYGPNDDADMEFDTLEEATEWFDNYKGFDDDEEYIPESWTKYKEGSQIYKDWNNLTGEIMSYVDYENEELPEIVDEYMKKNGFTKENGYSDKYIKALRDSAVDSLHTTSYSPSELSDFGITSDDIKNAEEYSKTVNRRPWSEVKNENSKNVIQQGKENTKKASKNAKQKIADAIGKKTTTRGSDGKTIDFNTKDATFKYTGSYPKDMMNKARRDSEMIETLGNKAIKEIQAGNITDERQLTDYLDYGNSVRSKAKPGYGYGFYELRSNRMWRDDLKGTEAEKEINAQAEYWRKKAKEELSKKKKS